jgi:hypothetical protein
LLIHVFPHLRTVGWDGVASPEDLTPSTPETWADFTTAHPTDALGVAYAVPGAEQFPLLTTAALPALVDAEQAPLLTWAIFDVDYHDAAGKHAPWPTPDHATRALRALPPGWGGYTTRRGIRAMVPLDPPLPVEFAKAFLASVSTALDLGADEKCYDWTRRFFLPRCRRDGVDLQAHVVEPTTTLNPYDDRFTLVAETPATPTLDPGDVPEPHDLTWEDRRHAAGFDWLLRGEPVPTGDDGSAFPVARSTLALVAARGKYTDPEILYSFVVNSARASVGSSVSDLGAVWRLCVWLADQQRASNAEEERREAAGEAPSPDDLPALAPVTPAEWADVRRALTGTVESKFYNRLQDGSPLAYHKARYIETAWEVARALVKGSALPADAIYRVMHRAVESQKVPLAPDLWAKVLDLVADRDDEGDKNDALRRAFCAMHPLTLATPEGRLYQLDTLKGQYKLTSEQLIEHHFRTLTAPGLPFDADYTGLPMRAILASYGMGVERTVFVSGRAGTTYDPVERRVVEGVHNLAAKRVVFHADVDGWLRLLGGNDPEGMLDWLASVTYTYDQPLCALYLRAPPGVGKSLLARGIASLWGAAPCDYNKVATGSFNAEVLACPLLFADEGIEVERNEHAVASRAFKNLTAGQALPINAKFAQVSPLLGALRTLIAANDDDGLPFRENLGKDGIDAIIARVRYIQVDPSAIDYLASLGGDKDFRAAHGERWAPQDCSPGAIAEHLLWLRDNRRVVPGGRFLVEGVPTRWHSQYAARQGIKPWVLQVVFALLEGARRGNKTTRTHEKDGLVWVTHRDVLEHWNEHAEARKPKPSVVVDALTNLASDRARRTVTGHSAATCYGIPPQAFIDAEVADADDFPNKETT